MYKIFLGVGDAGNGVIVNTIIQGLIFGIPGALSIATFLFGAISGLLIGILLRQCLPRPQLDNVVSLEAYRCRINAK